MFEKVLKMAKNYHLPLTFLYTDPDSESTMLHEAHRMGSNRRCRLLRDNGAKDKPDRNGLFPIERDCRIVQEYNVPNIEQEGPGEDGTTNTTSNHDTNHPSEINTEVSIYQGTNYMKWLKYNCVINN